MECYLLGVLSVQGSLEVLLLFNEIFFFSFSLEVVFEHVGHSANDFVDSLANQGVGRSSDLTAISM